MSFPLNSYGTMKGTAAIKGVGCRAWNSLGKMRSFLKNTAFKEGNGNHEGMNADGLLERGHDKCLLLCSLGRNPFQPVILDHLLPPT